MFVKLTKAEITEKHESWAAYDRWLTQNESEIRRRTLKPDTAFQAIVQAYLDGRRDAKDI